MTWGILFIMIGFALVTTIITMTPQHAEADALRDFGRERLPGTVGADVAADRLATVIVNAMVALFFAGGAGFVGLGTFAYMNKENNPQAAHGAWKKIAGGGALVAFAFTLGLLRETIVRAVA
jgi:GH24 family phage-related lysozyme (muramidase)